MSDWSTKYNAPEEDWRNTPKGTLATKKKELLKCNTIEELNKVYKDRSELTEFYNLMLDRIEVDSKPPFCK